MYRNSSSRLDIFSTAHFVCVLPGFIGSVSERHLTNAGRKPDCQVLADGGGTFTPPGHLIALTAQLVNDQHLSLASAAKLFAQVGIGLNDAGILCWKYKYRYNVLRPVTYIRTYIDSSWMPTIGTPPFPAYTSGHASFTAAAGGVLIARFGNSFSFTDQQKVAEGFAPRSFANFQSMVNEAAISRIYAGIHYEFDSEIGKQTGGI